MMQIQHNEHGTGMWDIAAVSTGSAGFAPCAYPAFTCAALPVSTKIPVSQATSFSHVCMGHHPAPSTQDIA